MCVCTRALCRLLLIVLVTAAAAALSVLPVWAWRALNRRRECRSGQSSLPLPRALVPPGSLLPAMALTILPAASAAGQLLGAGSMSGARSAAHCVLGAMALAYVLAYAAALALLMRTLSRKAWMMGVAYGRLGFFASAAVTDDGATPQMLPAPCAAAAAVEERRKAEGRFAAAGGEQEAAGAVQWGPPFAVACADASCSDSSGAGGEGPPCRNGTGQATSAASAHAAEGGWRLFWRGDAAKASTLAEDGDDPAAAAAAEDADDNGSGVASDIASAGTAVTAAAGAGAAAAATKHLHTAAAAGEGEGASAPALSRISLVVMHRASQPGGPAASGASDPWVTCACITAGPPTAATATPACQQDALDQIEAVALFGTPAPWRAAGHFVPRHPDHGVHGSMLPGGSMLAQAAGAVSMPAQASAAEEGGWCLPVPLPCGTAGHACLEVAPPSVSAAKKHARMLMLLPYACQPRKST